MDTYLWIVTHIVAFVLGIVFYGEVLDKPETVNKINQNIKLKPKIRLRNLLSRKK
jgi:hypothetical protein